MSDGVKTALSQARQAHRDSPGPPAPQGELFADLASRTELDAAIDQARSDEAIVEEAWRQAEAEHQVELGELNGGDSSRGPGRPKGARNLRTEEAARFYIRRHGDPLEVAVRLGAIPILAAGVLEALARRLACTKLEAAKFWASNNQAVMPYLRPRLAAITVYPQGSPNSSEAVAWEPWDYIDGELVDPTVNQEKALEAQVSAAELVGDTENTR
jgi:hypothetical protein